MSEQIRLFLSFVRVCVYVSTRESFSPYLPSFLVTSFSHFHLNKINDKTAVWLAWLTDWLDKSRCRTGIASIFQWLEGSAESREKNGRVIAISLFLSLFSVCPSNMLDWFISGGFCTLFISTFLFTNNVQVESASVIFPRRPRKQKCVFVLLFRDGSQE